MSDTPSTSTVTREPRSPPAPAAGALTTTASRKPRLERLDPTLEERLLLAGRRVVGVLLEVAELLGRADPADDLGPRDLGQLAQLVAQPRLALGGQGDRLRVVGADAWRCAARGARRIGAGAGLARRSAAERFTLGLATRALGIAVGDAATTRVGGAGATTGSGRSGSLMPVRRRSPVGRRRVANGRTARSPSASSPARSASETPASNAASSASSYSSTAAVGAHQTRSATCSRRVLSQ